MKHWREISSLAAGALIVCYAGLQSSTLINFTYSTQSGMIIEPWYFISTCRAVLLLPLIRHVWQIILLRKLAAAKLPALLLLGVGGFFSDRFLSSDGIAYATFAVSLALAVDVYVELLEFRRGKLTARTQ